MDFKYTKHQVARGALPDAETYDKIFLIKMCSILYATYQIKMLLFLAKKKKKKFIIELPKSSKIHSSLNELREKYPEIIKIKRF